MIQGANLVAAPARTEPESKAVFLWSLLSLTTLAVAFAPLVWQHAVQLWMRPYYQFFPFALAGAAWLAVSRWHGPGRLSPGRPRAALAAFAFAWAVLAAAAALDSSWLAAVGLLPALASVAYAA